MALFSSRNIIHMAQKFRQIEDLFGTGSLKTQNNSLFPEKNWENR